MEYCKNCYNSLEITRNTRKDESNIKSITKPDDLLKMKIQDGQQVIVNFNEGTLRAYIMENELDKETEKQLYQKFKQLLKQQKNVAQFIFLCNNCSTSYVIQPGTVLYNITFDNKNKIVEDEDVDVKIQDPILPRTKDYICPNGNCAGHKDTKNKEAVFYRISNGYNLKYICTVCKTAWNV